jgi:hypothetical protein
MWYSIGLSPISTIGLGRTAVSSDNRVPWPPARITAFINQAPFLYMQIQAFLFIQMMAFEAKNGTKYQNENTLTSLDVERNT